MTMTDQEIGEKKVNPRNTDEEAQERMNGLAKRLAANLKKEIQIKVPVEIRDKISERITNLSQIKRDSVYIIPDSDNIGYTTFLTSSSLLDFERKGNHLIIDDAAICYNTYKGGREHIFKGGHMDINQKADIEYRGVFTPTEKYDQEARNKLKDL